MVICGKYLLTVGKSNKYQCICDFMCQLIFSIREAKYMYNLWSKHKKGNPVLFFMIEIYIYIYNDRNIIQ